MLAPTSPTPPSIAESVSAILSPNTPWAAEKRAEGHPVLHVGRPNIANPGRFLELAREILERRWLTNNGPLVQQFEERIADYLGIKHCICVCNATIGLEIAIRAAGFAGEVIIPSYTFVASAHALHWQGITPVFCDIDPRTHNLDPRQLAHHITPRTSGILATHLWGRPCDIETLSEIAQERGLKLIFDAAHAFGCSHGGRMVGGFGHAEVFSFHATKFLNSCEGGAITTNDDELARRIRLMTNFGFSGYDNVIDVGINGKMTEICAAMGLSNLERISDLIETNRRNYDLYQRLLSGLPGLRLIAYDEREENNFQYIVLEVDPARARVTRDELVALLHGQGILARKYFWPGSHQMEPYRSLYPKARLLLANTESLAGRILVLPTGIETTADDICRICHLLQTTLATRTGDVEATGIRSIPESLGSATAKPDWRADPRWLEAPPRQTARLNPSNAGQPELR
jgi:dTDP-4-amino-4,6-dideoxygalactose transaminase